MEGNCFLRECPTYLLGCLLIHFLHLLGLALRCENMLSMYLLPFSGSSSHSPPLSGRRMVSHLPLCCPVHRLQCLLDWFVLLYRFKPAGG